MWPEEGGKLPLSSAVMWRQRGDLTATYNYLKYSYKDNGAKLFSGVPDDLTRGKSKVLQFGRLTLDIRRKSFNRRLVQHWNPHPGGRSVLRGFQDSARLSLSWSDLLVIVLL